jgi:tetratricopeptide (TPR) repeat protein
MGPPRFARRAAAWSTLIVIVGLLPAATVAGTAVAPLDLPVPPARDTFPAVPPAASEPRADPEVAVLEPLPRVGRGSDSPASTIYQELATDDADGVDRMAEAAFAAVSRVVGDAKTDALRSAVEAGVDWEEPDEAAKFEATIRAVAESLRGNEDADHLSDLAVALFLDRYIAPNDTERDRSDFAVEILRVVGVTVPDHPTVAVNLAFLRSLMDRSPEGTAAVIDDLRGYVSRNRDDVTARLLLASLESRRRDREGLDQALAILEPLLQQDDTHVVGGLATGDAYVATVDRWRELQPERSRQLAKRAIDSYDAVLESGGLAAAFAGRAVALDLIGERPAALAAMRSAVALNDSSAARWVQVATLESCLGDADATARDAETALERSADRNLLRDVRLVDVHEDDGAGVDRGFGGISLGSARETLSRWEGGDTGGGGFVVDLFSEVSDGPCLGPELSSPGAGRSLIIEASIARGNPGAIVALGGLDDAASDDDVLAAQLVAGTAPEDDGERVKATVRAAPAVTPERALAMCREVTPIAETIDVDTGALNVVLACGIRAAARANRPEDLLWALERLADRVDDDLDPDDAAPLLEGAEALRRMDRPHDAERFLRVATQVPELSVKALARLGDLRLERGDQRGAIALYDLAIDSGQRAADAGRADLPLLHEIQVARNNRGIAVLGGLAPSDSLPVDCGAEPEACRQAAADISAAVASDQGNWVYHWNAAWAARLQGDAGSAEAALLAAVDGNPRHARALNDLAVLEARRGAIDAAREHLKAALAVDGAFDLAAWNLGVLETRDPLSLVSGQRWLMVAIGRNRDLLTAPLALRFDERVVRVTADLGGRLEIDEVTRGPAVAGVALGGVAAVGGLVQLWTGVRGDIGGAVTDTAGRRLERRLRRWRLKGRARRALHSRGVAWKPWLTWVPVLGLLAVTTLVAVTTNAPDGAPGAIAISLLATVMALLTHAAGHAVARPAGTRIGPGRFDRGYVLAVVGLLLATPAGPFPAERIVHRDAAAAWRASLGGPLANLVAAVVACAIAFVTPIPFLRLLAAINLAVASYALIPAGTLDGSRLAKDRPDVVALVGLSTAVISAGLAIGIV